jgi:hypothetical protein
MGLYDGLTNFVGRARDSTHTDVLVNFFFSEVRPGAL